MSKKFNHKHVKEIRQIQEMTQAELAEKSGVAQQMISAIETGDKLPSLPTLIKIAEALNVKVGDLI